jgi:hypothetical protein
MPVLDEGNGFSLEIDAVDTCGARYALAYRSCANGAKGRLWLLEGLREVQAKYGIALGDVLVIRWAAPEVVPDTAPRLPWTQSVLCRGPV